MAKQKFTIRRSRMGQDRLSSAYIVERVEPKGRGIASEYRFSKTSIRNAEKFDSQEDAKRILKSLRNRDTSAVYAIVTI